MQSFARWVWRIWLNRDFKIFLALKVGFWGFLCCSLRGKVSKMNFLVFFQPTSMRAIRARYDPYLQTRHRVEQVTFSICKKMRITSIPWTGRVQQLNFYFSTVNKLWVLNCPTLTSITPGEFWTSCKIFSVQYLINNNNNNNNSKITSFGCCSESGMWKVSQTLFCFDLFPLYLQTHWRILHEFSVLSTEIFTDWRRFKEF